MHCIQDSNRKIPSSGTCSSPPLWGLASPYNILTIHLTTHRAAMLAKQHSQAAVCSTGRALPVSQECRGMMPSVTLLPRYLLPV